MPMSPRLLRPRSGGVHPETQDWRSRVIANGGSVSGTTLTAVDRFVKAIHAAGIRDRFYRLNLLCGTGLNACLVPLYRGRSAGGAQYGGTTDTNVNFVSDDYVETGANGGLKSDGATKYLNTGFKAPSASASVSDFHLGLYAHGVEANGTSRLFMGITTNQVGANLSTFLGWATSGSISTASINETTNLTAGTTDRQGLLLAVNNGNRNTIYYDDAVSAATHSGSRTEGFETGAGDEFFVCARNFLGTAQLPTLNKRVRAYTIGLSLTAAQVTAFQDAMVAFQTALSRNV